MFHDLDSTLTAILNDADAPLELRDALQMGSESRLLRNENSDGVKC